MTRNYAYYIAFQSEVGLGSTYAIVKNGINTADDMKALIEYIANKNGLKQVIILSIIRLPGSDTITNDEVNTEAANEQE